MFEKVVKRAYRERGREIACRDWVEAEFDVPRAIELSKASVAESRAKGEFGNPLVAVMVAYYVLLIIQMAYKYWKSKQVQHPPAQSEPGEPFGLTGGAS